ncbi:peptidoglycan recognition family protein [Methylobacter sp. Wu1]|uniref:peptidoglycan recognition protein family protein n=1 Tax=Methylobacter sp. Wu1 TaxID=3119359 RepID=UPI002F942BDE
MAESTSDLAVEIKNGKLVTPKIIDKVNSKIEKGSLSIVNAIIIHQTGSGNAQSSLSSYNDGANGAHFLIDKDGTIYQTARINQKCWHVGNIRSRCGELKSCSADELKKIEAILFKKGEAYGVRIKNLSKHEMSKNYPDRYPTNEDSLGIEIVGSFDSKSDSYEIVNKQQNSSLTWLISVLQSSLSLSGNDIYRHPEVSYKQASEAKTAQWK